MRAAAPTRWTDGDVARLRRHLAKAFEKHGDGHECAAVAAVARDFGISSAQVRAVIAHADRQDAAAAARTAASKRPAHVDVYREQRQPIIERLQKGLNPHASWRDPREVSAGILYRPDNTPWENTVAGACVWLRKNQTGRHDVSGDVLWCLVMQERCEAEAERVITALTHAWIDKHQSIATLARTPTGLVSVERAAAVLVAQCVSGVPTRRKIPLQWKQWCMVQESGEWMLWNLADAASRRAVAALR